MINNPYKINPKPQKSTFQNLIQIFLLVHLDIFLISSYNHFCLQNDSNLRSLTVLIFLLRLNHLCNVLFMLHCCLIQPKNNNAIKIYAKNSRRHTMGIWRFRNLYSFASLTRQFLFAILICFNNIKKVVLILQINLLTNKHFLWKC